MSKMKDRIDRIEKVLEGKATARVPTSDPLAQDLYSARVRLALSCEGILVDFIGDDVVIGRVPMSRRQKEMKKVYDAKKAEADFRKANDKHTELMNDYSKAAEAVSAARAELKRVSEALDMASLKLAESNRALKK